MKVGDLVQFRISKSNKELVDEFGYGLIEAIYKEWNGVEGVEVVWPKKHCVSRKISRAYLETINESR